MSREYTGREPSTTVRQPDGSPKLKFQELPPDDIAVLTGEAVYQMRSALDHLAFDLVKLNPTNIELPADWEDHCCFPIWFQRKKSGKYNCFSRNLPGISEAAFTFIEGVQPYHGGNTALRLGLLAKLSNIDKHRHLNIVNPQAHQREVIRYRGSTEFTSIRRVTSDTKLDSDLFPSEIMQDAVKVERGFHPYVSFDESALGIEAAKLPVKVVLEMCFDLVQEMIVPAFDKFLQNG